MGTQRRVMGKGRIILKMGHVPIIFRINIFGQKNDAINLNLLILLPILH